MITEASLNRVFHAPISEMILKKKFMSECEGL